MGTRTVAPTQTERVGVWVYTERAQPFDREVVSPWHALKHAQACLGSALRASMQGRPLCALAFLLVAGCALRALLLAGHALWALLLAACALCAVPLPHLALALLPAERDGPAGGAHLRLGGSNMGWLRHTCMRRGRRRGRQASRLRCQARTKLASTTPRHTHVRPCHALRGDPPAASFRLAALWRRTRRTACGRCRRRCCSPRSRCCPHRRCRLLWHRRHCWVRLGWGRCHRCRCRRRHCWVRLGLGRCHRCRCRRRHCRRRWCCGPHQRRRRRPPGRRSASGRLGAVGRQLAVQVAQRRLHCGGGAWAGAAMLMGALAVGAYTLSSLRLCNGGSMHAQTHAAQPTRGWRKTSYTDQSTKGVA